MGGIQCDYCKKSISQEEVRNLKQGKKICPDCYEELSGKYYEQRRREASGQEAADGFDGDGSKGTSIPERPEKSDRTSQATPVFYSDPDNSAFLEYLLNERGQDSISIFFNGFATFYSIFRSAHGYMAGMIATCFVYPFVSPVYCWLAGKNIKSMQIRRNRINSKSTQVSEVYIGQPRDKFGITASLPGISLLYAFKFKKRKKEIAEDIKKHCGTNAKNARSYYAMVKALLEHFDRESGTFVADPHQGIFDVYSKFDRYPGKDYDWYTYKRELCERKEFSRGHPLVWMQFKSPKGKCDGLQDVLNRHWEFHRFLIPSARPGTFSDWGAYRPAEKSRHKS